MSNLKFKIKNLKFRSERGVTILLTLIVLSIVLATAVAASGVVAFQILLAGDVSNSIAAIGDAGSYKVQYSDDDISYSDVATLNLSAALGGWNTVAWSDVGSHQYWRFLISAGGSPTIDINELEMYPAALWSGMSNGATFTTSVVWGSPTILESLGVYKTAKRKFRLTF